MEGAQRIMLGSNNYLGLTGDERVMKGAEDALHRYGTGLTGSRLLNGTIPLHLELEREIAEWMDTEDALVFSDRPPGQPRARSARCSAPADTVIVDSGDHASILDGCLLSRAKLRPFRHNRLDKLEKMLDRAQGDGGGVLVVVDGVFSMEGDIAPLGEICELCERYGARLMVDEAHGAGVLGARGAGAAELLGVADRVDLRMGTFSKSLASCGGFVAGPAEVIDYLRLSSRAFLFTASAVPAALGAALAALRVVRSDDGPPLLERVLANARFLRDGLHELGFAVVSPQTLPADGRAQTGTPGLLGGNRGTRERSSPRSSRCWSARTGRRRCCGGPLRRRGVREHGAAPRRSARRRAAADERDGHARHAHARPRPGGLRPRQARVRGRARPAAGPRARLIRRRTARRSRRPPRSPRSRRGPEGCRRRREPPALVHFFTSRGEIEKDRF